MSEAIITVENLSKRYKLGTIGATTLRDSVERAWHGCGAAIGGRRWGRSGMRQSRWRERL